MTSHPDLTRLKIDHNAQQPTNTKSRFSFLKISYLVIPCLLAIIIYQNSKFSESNSAPSLPTTVQTSASTVPTAVAAKSNVLNATGYVVAQRKAAVASKATGRLQLLHVVEGDVLQAGQIIAELENEDLVAIVQQQEAQLVAAKAQARLSEAEAKDAGTQLVRMSSLAKDKVISEMENDTVQATSKKAKASLDLAEANIAAAEAQLAKAKVDLDYTLIRSPFAGTVLTKNADVGEIVAPFGSSTNARAAVVTIADMDSLQVEADISESNIAKIKIGQPCTITLDSFPNKSYHGILEKIVPTVDRAKATVLAKIRFTDRDKDVIPEMSAKVEFPLQEKLSDR